MGRSDRLAASSDHYEGQDLEALVNLENYYQWILGTFAPYLRGRVLEVGAGTGNFASNYVDAADDVVLLEPARNLHTALADRFRDRRHVRVVGALLEEVCGPTTTGPSLLPNSFDTAILVNVLEHIPDDRGTLCRLRQLLRPEGTLLVFVPALSWLYGSLDALVHHVRRYSRRRLARRVRRAGFAIERLHYFDLLGMVSWLVAGRILRQHRFSPLAARFYDRCVVPLTAYAESWITPPLGKNLICVARQTLAATGVLESSRTERLDKAA